MMPIYDSPQDAYKAQKESRDATRRFLEEVNLLRLWSLYDAAHAICENETPEAWEALYKAAACVVDTRKA